MGRERGEWAGLWPPASGSESQGQHAILGQHAVLGLDWSRIGDNGWSSAGGTGRRRAVEMTAARRRNPEPGSRPGWGPRRTRCARETDRRAPQFPALGGGLLRRGRSLTCLLLLRGAALVPAHGTRPRDYLSDGRLGSGRGLEARSHNRTSRRSSPCRNTGKRRACAGFPGAARSGGSGAYSASRMRRSGNRRKAEEFSRTAESARR
jgi:hypothetical protein